MKKRASLLAGLGLAASIALAAGAAGKRAQISETQDSNPQQIQKPAYDYMSSYLSRSTRPLGLNVDPLVREMLGQRAAKWALRAGIRHALD